VVGGVDPDEPGPAGDKNVLSAHVLSFGKIGYPQIRQIGQIYVSLS
jgi:hypothetical protein